MTSVDEGLQTLIARGFRFQHLKNEDGHVVILIGSYGYQGDAVMTIRELLAVPKLHEPNAPQLARPAPVGLWLPGPGRAMPGPFVVPP